MLALKVDKRDKMIGFAVSTALGLIILVSATFVWPGYESHPGWDNFIVVALIIAIFPPSMLDMLDRRYRNALDAKLPDLIRDIADSQKTGMSFTRAIEHTARLNYGPLTKELKKTVASMGWGTPYDEALREMADRIGTPLAQRTISLFNEVGRSGGKLFEILDMVYSHVREVQDLQNERRRQVSPYVAMIYASFGVYIFVVFILFATFFSQIAGMVETGSPFGGQINPQVYHLWFFHMSLVEAIFAGFIAGKMSEGSMAAGLKHVLVLVTASLLIFTFLITV